MALASTAILGFGTHDQTFIRSKTVDWSDNQKISHGQGNSLVSTQAHHSRR
jgi:hypothetical protein